MNYTKKLLHKIFSDDAIILYAYNAMGEDIRRLQKGRSGIPKELSDPKKFDSFFKKYKYRRPKTYSKQHELEFLRKIYAYQKKHPRWNQLYDQKRLTETERYAVLRIGEYIGIGPYAKEDIKYIHGNSSTVI